MDDNDKDTEANNIRKSKPQLKQLSKYNYNNGCCNKNIYFSKRKRK